MSEKAFIVTEDHLKLLRRAYVGWDDYSGAESRPTNISVHDARWKAAPPCGQRLVIFYQTNRGCN